MVSKREKGEKEYFQRNVSITEDIGHIAGSCMPIFFSSSNNVVSDILQYSLERPAEEMLPL